MEEKIVSFEASGANAAISAASESPFVPISTLSTREGTSLSIGGIDGREIVSIPVFANVFAYPLFVHYDSKIAASAALSYMPYGVRISAFELFESSGLTRGDGTRIPFVAAEGGSNVLYDPMGSGLYAEPISAGTRVTDALTGGYSDFDASGRLLRKVDGYGVTLLSVDWSGTYPELSDSLGNSIALGFCQLSLNGGTHVLTLTRNAYSRLSSVSYHGPSPDSGWTKQVTASNKGLTRLTEPSGEALGVSFYADKKAYVARLGVVQGTSLAPEESITFYYYGSRAETVNYRGLRREVTFDSDGVLETMSDGSGVREVFPKGFPRHAGFSRETYCRHTLGDLTYHSYGTGLIDVASEQVAPVSSTETAMRTGRTYCAIATVDFSSCTQPSGTSSLRCYFGFTAGAGGVWLDFDGTDGAKRTRYAFFSVPNDCGLSGVQFSCAGLNGAFVVKELALVCASEVRPCLPAAAGAIGPFFGKKWAEKGTADAFGPIGSPSFASGCILPEDAMANALLAKRGKQLFYSDGLRKLRAGSYGYGPSVPKISPASAEVGFRLSVPSGIESLARVLPDGDAVEFSRAIKDGDTESVSSERIDLKGSPLGSMGPVGGETASLDGFGRPALRRRVHADGTFGESASYSYVAGTHDPRPSRITDDYASVSYSYLGADGRASSAVPSDSSLGAPSYYEYGPRGEGVSSVSCGGCVLSSSYVGTRPASFSQGTGSATFLYGLGGLAYFQGGGTVLSYASRIFSASQTRTTVLSGPSGGTRADFTPYGRPSVFYGVPGSGSAVELGRWEYGFPGNPTETSSTPVLSFRDSAAGTEASYSYPAPRESSSTVSALSADSGFRALTRTISKDAFGRTVSLSVNASGVGFSQSASYSYVAGTGHVSGATSSFSAGGYSGMLVLNRPLDGKGRVSYDYVSDFTRYVRKTPSYSADRVGSVATVVGYGSTTLSATESLSYDSAGRVVSVSRGGTDADRYERDGVGRIVREDNAALGLSFRYEYDSSGNLWRVSSCAYTSSASPSFVPFRTLGFSSSYGPFLASVDGVSATLSGGYPTQISGQTLTWLYGRLASFGANSFSYDARGHLIARSGNGRASSFVYDDEGRLLCEVGQGYSLYFLYGMSGMVGFSYVAGSFHSRYLFVFDALGNVSALLGASGIVARYAYDAFGNGKVYDGSWNENASPSFVGNVNPIRYKGGLYDRESGLYKFGARWYCPSIYRWLSPDGADYIDPSRIDGANPYAYCYNDPVNYTDRTGHSPWSEFWDGVGNWFGDHWVELAIGAGAIAVGVITMGVGAAIGGATFAGVMATMGTATLQSIASTVVSAAVSGLISGGISAINNGDFLGGFGDGFASGFMWGGIISGASNVLSGALTITRAMSPGFNGANVGTVRFWSPNSASNPHYGGTLVKFGKYFRLDTEPALGLHFHMALTGKMHFPVSWLIGGLIGTEW